MTTQLGTTQDVVDDIGIQGEQLDEQQDSVPADTQRIQEVFKNVVDRTLADIDAQPFGPSDALLATLSTYVSDSEQVTREWKRTEHHFAYEYTIRIGPETIAQTVQRSYKKKIANSNFAGFRRGKIPFPIFLQRVGKTAFYKEIQEEILGEEYVFVRKSLKKYTILNAEVQSSSFTDEEGLVCTIVMMLNPPVVMPDEQQFVLPHIPEQNLDVETAIWEQSILSRRAFHVDQRGARVSDAVAQQFDQVLVQCIIAHRVQNGGGRSDEDAQSVFEWPASACVQDVHKEVEIALIDLRNPFVHACIGRREQSAFFVDIDLHDPNYASPITILGGLMHFFSSHLMNTRVDLCDEKSSNVVTVAVLIKEIHRLPPEMVEDIKQIGTTDEGTEGITEYLNFRVHIHFENARFQAFVHALIKQSSFMYSRSVFIQAAEHLEWRLLFIGVFMKEHFLDFDQRDASFIDGLQRMLERILMYEMKLAMLCNEVMARRNLQMSVDVSGVDLSRIEPIKELLLQDQYGSLQIECLRMMYKIDKASAARDILSKIIAMQAVGSDIDKRLFAKS